jgi:hypothetical protein
MTGAGTPGLKAEKQEPNPEVVDLVAKAKLFSPPNTDAILAAAEDVAAAAKPPPETQEDRLAARAKLTLARIGYNKAVKAWLTAFNIEAARVRRNVTEAAETLYRSTKVAVADPKKPATGDD